MNYRKFLLLLVSVGLTSTNLWATEVTEENPLVADTFTKKKIVSRFAPYETVAVNYLEGGELQLGLAAGVRFQKIVAESTSSSPIAYTLDSTGTKWVEGLAIKYGVTDYFSVAADVTYAHGSTSTESVVTGTSSTSNDKVAGIEQLAVRGQLALPLGSFGYLADVEWVPAIGKASSNAQTEESNAYHEQSNLQINNYFIFNASSVKWGALLGYDYRFVGEVEQISATGTVTIKEVSGGNTLEAGGFVEFEKFFKTNILISYVKSESSTRVTSAGVSSEIPALDFISLLAMSEFKVTRKTSFVPQFQYVTLLNKSVDPTVSYTQTDIFGISGTLRILF